MSGMVPYTDQQPPTNRYRHQLIAPPRAGVRCVSAVDSALLHAAHRRQEDV